MKKYLITGLLIWIPLVITLWVLKLIVDALDQTLLLLPPEFRTENWLGIHVPGMGAVMTLVIVFLTGAVRHQPDRRAPGALLARDPAPHPGGQLDLFQRQADLRHAVLLQRPGVPQGAAGAVAARRACGPSPSSPAARAATSPITCRATSSASTCRPRPTRPAATS